MTVRSVVGWVAKDDDDSEVESPFEYFCLAQYLLLLSDELLSAALVSTDYSHSTA